MGTVCCDGSGTTGWRLKGTGGLSPSAGQWGGEGKEAELEKGHV